MILCMKRYRVIWSRWRQGRIEGDMNSIEKFFKSRVRFDRNEFAGAFGDIGTDFPLIMGMILACGIDGSSVFIAYGAMQILTALIYGIPMPVQPLKMVALLAITQKLGGGVIFGGGLVIGAIMLLFTLTGIIEYLGKIIPLAVIRGVQMGLGLQLAMLSLKEYIPSGSTAGLILAGIAFIITIALLGNRRFPPALIIIALGVIYGIIITYDPALFGKLWLPPLPKFSIPTFDDMATGLIVLAIPQIPLSLGNSIYASSQIVKDYFPDKNIGVRKIGFTYSLMNIISPLFGGVPVCHGSGGLVGHYTFGARTGGSIVIYGIFYLVMGVLTGGNINALAGIFPKPLLGVILLFEGLALLNLAKDRAAIKNEFIITLIVALFAICIPYGYLTGMATGSVIYHLFKGKTIALPDPSSVLPLKNSECAMHDATTRLNRS